MNSCRPAQGASDPLHTALRDWIAREAIPFSVDSTASLSASVDRVVAALGDSVELLGFGEALHGSEDILVLRNRLFQRLVEAHGFSAIAIESSFPRAHAVNEYLAGRGPGSYEALQDTGFSHGFGRLEANRELLEWMRWYNAEPAHGVKLRFYGFDSPTEMSGADSPRRVLYFALDYLASIDPAGAREHRERIDSFLGDDSSWENPAAAFDPAKSVGLSPAATALRIETEDLISELVVRRPEFVATSGECRYLEAAHHASMARQLLNYHAVMARDSSDRVSRLLGMRDAMMADNLAYIVSRERARARAARAQDGGHGRGHASGKVLAFAHNSHLQRGQALWQWGPLLCAWWPAGAHLDATFGSRYAVIGSAVGVSEANGIGHPEEDTLEALLTAVPGPGLFVPTHRGRGLPAEAITALQTRSGSRKNTTYFPLTPRSFTDFDWFAVLDSTAYARGGPPLP